MKTIRNNVFETNSSSSHSISVNYILELDQTLPPNEAGYIVIEEEAFGRPYPPIYHTDPAIKASYLMVSWRNDQRLLETLRRAIETYCGYPVKFDDHEICYVDHDSNDIAHNMLNYGSRIHTDEEIITRFLFSSQSTLIEAGD